MVAQAIDMQRLTAEKADIEALLASAETTKQGAMDEARLWRQNHDKEVEKSKKLQRQLADAGKNDNRDPKTGQFTKAK